MPKRQSTAAQMARLRQAGTGEKYTQALRPLRFRMFSARGAGWDPITERTARQLAQIWPAGPRPHWEEKFGELCWKTFPRWDAPAEATVVVRKALAEAAITCQTCPSPGRKRVVWIWDTEYGWITPWVKTCCDCCYRVPRNLTNTPEYLDLLWEYEEPEPDADHLNGCCDAIEDVASAVRAQFDAGGVPALLAELVKLRESIGERSPHHDVFSGHAVVLAVEQACAPLLYRIWQTGVVSEPLLPEPERRRVEQAVDGLQQALHEMVGEEHRD
ncbi:hypothetical protein ACWGFX_18140 [Streptomyces xanthophaeus]